MSFQFTPLTPELSVAAQLTDDDMILVAQAGFKSLIINRPDYEGGPEQPLADKVMQAALAAGLQAVYQPVVSGQLTLDDARTFKKHLEHLPKPILAYCRSGGRCTNLFIATQNLAEDDPAQ